MSKIHEDGLLCGLYQHYKGGVYLVLGLAEHTETEERLVIYVALGVTLSGPRLRARPVREFTSYVSAGIPRYTFIGHDAT